MRKLSYSFTIYAAIVILAQVFFGSQALALPTTSQDVIDPYNDGRTVALDQLTTKTVSNLPQEPSKEHDPTKNQAQIEATLEPEVNLGFTTSGPHGRFTDNTSACGRCHQLHQANAQRLIRFNVMPAGSSANNTIYGTCTYCHSFNGQSTYDVKDGMIWDTNDGKRYATSGGGFERMLVVEGEPAVATVVKATSSHRVNYNTGTKFKPPGGYMGGVASGHIELTCSSCHNPHGSKHGRQLRERITVGAPNGVATPTVTSSGFEGIIVNVANPFGNELITYNGQINNFCSTCHYDYNAGSTAKGGAYNQKHRHKMGMSAAESINSGSAGKEFGFDEDRFQLPLATIGTGAPGNVMCLTCHFAHGTFTTVKDIPTYDSLVVSTGGTTVDLQKLDGTNMVEPSKNLRKDNRGVCQNCHNWPSVSTVPNTLVDVLDPDQKGDIVYGETGSLLTNTKLISKSNNTITIRFREYVLRGGVANSAEDTSQYTVTKPGPANITINSATVQPDGRTVVLTLNENLVPTTSYNVSISNVKDTNGITMAPYSGSFTK